MLGIAVPKFVFVRYCPGSCGNFVIANILWNRSVAHWAPTLESDRKEAEFDTKHLEWFRSRFQPDLTQHLKHEPHHPYQLDFVSAKHARGDDLSLDEFLQHLLDRNDQHFFSAVERGKLIVLRLNKSSVPQWAAGSKIINIVIDPISHKWLHRTRYIKLFGRENGQFVSKENHPDFLKSKFKSLQFHNRYSFDSGPVTFIRHNVILEPTVKIFKTQAEILSHESNRTCTDQLFIDLSALFTQTDFSHAMHDIYDYLDLGEPSASVVAQSWQHYFVTNIQPILQRVHHYV